MITLGIETSTDICAVALLDGETLLGASSLRGARTHATQLAPLIRTLLSDADVRADSLQAVAVSTGPGSFTGLRIGLSTGKGLCMAVGAQLAAVPTPEALALEAFRTHSVDRVLTAQRSRRGEVYLASFERGSDGPHCVTPIQAVTLDSCADRLRDFGPLALVGDGAEILMEACGSAGISATDLGIISSAEAVARIGRQIVLDGRAADVAAVEPTYVSSFVASRPNAIFPTAAS